MNLKLAGKQLELPEDGVYRDYWDTHELKQLLAFVIMLLCHSCCSFTVLGNFLCIARLQEAENPGPRKALQR